MSDTIRAWYEFTLAQIAADSYLDNEQDPDFTIEQDDLVRVRFRNGANHYKHIEDNERDNNLSATRMTEVMIGDFFDTWEIIDHQENQPSGFSGTLLKHKITGEYTLSFRSTESKDVVDGGDVERDSSDGANGQIKDLGLAYGQLIDMETYYQALQTKGHLGAGTKINVTGYSLGGHLAQAFTRLHEESIIQTYTFNGAGFGDLEGVASLSEGGTTEQVSTALKDRLAQMKDAQKNPENYLSQVTANEFAALGYPINALPQNLDEKKREALTEIKTAHDVFIQAHENNPDASLYDDPLFQFALRTLPEGDRGNLSVGLEELIFGQRIGDDIKITNLYGHNSPGDDRLLGEVVAGAGQIFGSFLSIYIEDQPLFNPQDSETLEDKLLRSFGASHSISLLADSLVVMELMQTLDPDLKREDMNQIFASASASKRDGSRAEGDSLDIIYGHSSKALLLAA